MIENVEVYADVTSNVASSSYGTAGLVGKVSGATTITNCGVTGNVKNTATGTYSTAYTGGLDVYKRQAERGIWVSCALLAVSFLIMFIREEEAK